MSDERSGVDSLLFFRMPRRGAFPRLGEGLRLEEELDDNDAMRSAPMFRVLGGCVACLRGDQKRGLLFLAETSWQGRGGRLLFVVGFCGCASEQVCGDVV